jgi:hypothetical protein
MNAKRNKIIAAILSAVLATLTGLTLHGDIQKIITFDDKGEIGFAIITTFMAMVFYTLAFGNEPEEFGNNTKKN